jgi:hypothetical protein
MKKHLVALFLVVSAPLTWAQPTAPHTTESLENFQPETGLAALDFKFDENTASAEALGLFSAPISFQSSTTDRNLVIKPWLQLSAGSQEQVNIDGSTIPPFESPIQGDTKQSMNAMFTFGNFQTVAKIQTNNENLFSGNSISITGYYNFYTKESFTLSVKANLKTLNSGDVASYYHQVDYKVPNSDIFSSQATNHSFGIVGTLRLSPNWQASGELSTTSLDNQIEQSPFIKKNSVQMAQIKTSYSF